MIAPDSLTGADIREDTLVGVQRGTYVSASTTIAAGINDAVLSAGGLQLTAQCSIGVGTQIGIIWRVRNISGAQMKLVLRSTSGTADDVQSAVLGDSGQVSVSTTPFSGAVGRIFTVQAVPSAGGTPVTITASAITDTTSCLVMANATQ